MVNKINSCSIVFEEDITNEEFEAIKRAFMHFRNVVAIVPTLSDIPSIVAQERIRRELLIKLLNVINIHTAIKSEIEDESMELQKKT